MPPDIAEFEIAYQERLKAEVRKPKGLKIDEYIEKHKEIIYNYDFGDNWQFIVRFEDIVDDYYFGYPTLLDGAVEMYLPKGWGKYLTFTSRDRAARRCRWTIWIL